jgi:hypothetical protein
MSDIKFGTWAKTECSSCNQEFQVTRTEARSFESNSKIICSECKDYGRAYKDGVEAGKASSMKQLAQYESIVKKVDADNLPKSEVLALGEEGGMLLGHVASTYEGMVWCETHEEVLYEITHYIEQKDLIKLFK